MLDYYIGLYKQPRQFCETSADVTNYVNGLCETMCKSGATEIEFPLVIQLFCL